MNPQGTAARTGVARGWIELRNTFASKEEVLGALFPNAILLVVMLFQRGGTVPGTDFSLGSTVLPSVIGMSVATGGLLNVSQVLATEREDGTLLRAKAIPNGMLGYLIGKIVQSSGMTLFGILILLIPGVILFDDVATGGFISWVTFVWVLLLGLVATMPIGAVVGSLLSSPRGMGLVMLPLMGLVAISGIFYPITALPDWLQWIGQIFPLYWLGLGMRSGLLPDDMVVAELGESWRHVETFGVLGAWSIAGLIVAPMVLRRMARRESGSTVAARREKAMQQVA